MRIKAKCPDCGDDLRLEEVMDNVTVYTEIFGLHEGGDAE